MKNSKLGMIYTFYSYKGGVGRSMALANVAALLALWGKRVLIVDWDLEAPGIEKYFSRWIEQADTKVPGVVDMVEAIACNTKIKWNDNLLHVNSPGGEVIHILSAGKDLNRPDGDREYVKRLRSLKWDKLFKSHKFGSFLESLRDEWRSEYDFVLIDSRTGITDIGGICTIHLPDVLVSFFTANEQSLEGVREVMYKARTAHSKLPVDRRRLLLIPVPSRDESGSEYELSEKWREKFAQALKECINDWMPKNESPSSVLDYLKIPYFAYWSFGERVPVFEQSDPENPKTLAYAYQPLARLVLSGLNWEETRRGEQSNEAAREHEAKTAVAKLETEKLREKQDRDKHIQREADQFLEGRFVDIISECKDQARKSRWMEVGGIVVIFGSLLMIFTDVFRYFSYLSEFSDEISFNLRLLYESGIAATSFSFISMLFLTSLLMVLLRPGRTYRERKTVISTLLRQEAIFKINFPGEDPGNELKEFISKVEGEYARATGG